jgi:hypothetical protein
MRARIIGLFLALTLSLGTIASAKCGSGLPLNYDDISAVMFSQSGCRSTLGRKTIASFECSSFYAFFWAGGRPQGWTTPVISEYVQNNLPGATGTYNLSLSISRVRNVLRKDSFFTISPPDLTALDTAESVLSVRRCAVLTKVNIFDSRDAGDVASRKLFDDMRALIKGAAKKLVSRKPKIFDLTGAFDP